eukprot:scaffold9899_cov55-Cylindrotheca_fusiformis.AAC.1
MKERKHHHPHRQWKCSYLSDIGHSSLFLIQQLLPTNHMQLTLKAVFGLRLRASLAINGLVKTEKKVFLCFRVSQKRE